jgi:hypothetical protein
LQAAQAHFVEEEMRQLAAPKTEPEPETSPPPSRPDSGPKRMWRDSGVVTTMCGGFSIDLGRIAGAYEGSDAGIW